MASKSSGAIPELRFTARRVHPHLPQQLRTDCEKVAPVLPLLGLLAGHAQIGFMHQRRGLHCVAIQLTAQMVASQLLQFPIHDRQ
jgi:hypothetical protein